MAARCEEFIREMKCAEENIEVKHLNKNFNAYDDREPKGRSGHCVCSDESNMYVFGGYSPCDERNNVAKNQVLPELWKLNFASQKWIEIKTEDIPTTCASSSILVSNRLMFVFGGTSYPFGHIMSNTIKALNYNRGSPKRRRQHEPHEEETKAKTNAWYLLETNPMCYSAGGDVEDYGPPPAYGQSVIFHKDALYVFAGAVGFYSEAISDLHRFDLHEMTWEKLRPTGKVPSGRYKQEVATSADRFYVLGGGRLCHAEHLDKIHVYHVTRNHWTEESAIPDSKHGYPKPRCSFGFAQFENSVYISGGRHYNNHVEHRSLKDIWHLQLDTLKWTKANVELPVPVYFHGSVVSKSGHMYIFGGVHPDGFRTPYLYRMRLPFSMPKLSELCWERVSESCRSRNGMSKDDLTSLGIPWTFIDRVELPEKEPRGFSPV